MYAQRAKIGVQFAPFLPHSRRLWLHKNDPSANGLDVERYRPLGLRR